MAVSPTRRYLVAGGMVVLAVALGAVFGLVVARALAGYTITPVADPESFNVTGGDRARARWVSPATATTYCSAKEVGTGRDSFGTGGSTTMTVTDGGRTWERVGLVRGAPGSKHQISCSAETPLTIGQADSPRLARYVVLGIAIGIVDLLLIVVAGALALTTALRRKPAAG